MRYWLAGLLIVLISPSSIAGAMAGAEVLATELAEPQPLAVGAWELTAATGINRVFHSSTLLPTGELLVAGGQSGVSVASAELFDPGSGRWRDTGAMVEARERHTALWLNTGKILVTGGVRTGTSGSEVLSSAELYDPATGVFSAIGGMAQDRYFHSATLLPTGKVLVVGGFDGAGVLASAELYDPAAGTWSAAGSLAIGRTNHTATLLATGKVLISGGAGPAGEVAIAELYDPATGSFSSSGAMTSPRQRHTATLLRDGRVLAAGGSCLWGSALCVAAEVYDPDSGTWSSTGSLASGRSFHTATLLPSGAVLVSGGAGPLTGGSTYPAGLTGAELYNPTTGSWESQAPMASARYWHTATLLPSGDVAVVGGFTGENHLATVELFQPARGVWASAAPSLETRYWHTGTLLPNGRVLIAGGYRDGASLANSELFDPNTGSWLPTGALAESRGYHTATLLPSGKVLVVGGAHSELGFPCTTLSSAELYDPLTGMWENTGSLAVRRHLHTATLLDSGKVLVAGGAGKCGENDPQVLDSVEIYDPSTGTWSFTDSLADLGRWLHTATLLPSGEVLVTGGMLASTLKSSEIYDPHSGRWRSAGRMEYPRRNHTATLLPSGLVLVAGGHSGNAVAQAEVYDPILDRFTVTGEMPYPAFYHSASLLPNGKVLLFGGCDFIFIFGRTQIYDPATGQFNLGPSANPRRLHSATLLPSGKLLIYGGDANVALNDAALFSAADPAGPAPPHILAVSGKIQYGQAFAIFGERLGGPFEGSSGDHRSSAVNHPLIRLHQVATGRSVPLLPDPRPSLFSNDQPEAILFSYFPLLAPGFYQLQVVTAGVAGQSVTVEVECGLTITRQPQNRVVELGALATFEVVAEGARLYQWYKDGQPIPEASSASYTTGPISAPDSGSVYQVEVDSGCGSAPVLSSPATVGVVDLAPPAVAVDSPSGGELWTLLPAATEFIHWTMSDNVRICRVEVSLLYSDDGGASYHPAPPGGGLPATFEAAAGCRYPGVPTTSLAYALPADPPSGRPGSLYKVHLEVEDSAGLTATADSARAFFIGHPDPTVKTLILWHSSRMAEKLGLSPAQIGDLRLTLEQLAAQSQVQGRVVDLGEITDLQPLYAAWDAGGSNAPANDVLFAPSGIHDQVQGLVETAYNGVEYLLVVGDDRMVPMARMEDHTVLHLESNYTTAGPNAGLTSEGTTVGRALAANFYLSDDPLATLRDLRPADLQQEPFFLPTLAVGRLVESYQEIVLAIATFISQGGVLDLGPTADLGRHKAQITAYDFLRDSGTMIRERFGSLWGGPAPGDALAPIDGQLIGQTWQAADLKSHLCGNASGEPYGVLSLNGHATHYEEGFPAGPFSLHGVAADELLAENLCSGSPLDLSGSLVYSVGCHSGLPVAGSTSPADHPIDLPQTFLRLGALAYVGNTGYGWGLLSGIGLSERLALIYTEAITTGRTTAVGQALRESKERYFLESPRFDAYDRKTSMQWTLYGFPMYRLLGSAALAPEQEENRHLPAEGSRSENLGKVRVQSRVADGGTAFVNPSSLTRVETNFDFSAPGVFVKRGADGTAISGAGCPASQPDGCYYTLNGLAERSTGETDLPVEPYTVHDSRLAGTSQHGVLWMGGRFVEEAGWRPVIGTLVSNGGANADQSALPRTILIRPRGPNDEGILDASPADCRPADREINSVVLTAGESVWSPATESYSRHRNYDFMALEYFYFNDGLAGGANCDRQGPVIGATAHSAEQTPQGWEVSFVVAAADPDLEEGVARQGIWRIVVVFSDERLDPQDRGAWIPLELSHDANLQRWTGVAILPAEVDHLVYYLQAVDLRGNVSWLEYAPGDLPGSGVPLGIPKPVLIDLDDMSPPSAPTIVPVTPDPSAERRPVFTWLTVADAVSYRLQVSSSSLFTELQIDELVVGTSFVPVAALAEGIWHWRVSCRDAADNESVFSSPGSFTIDLTPPAVPSLVPVEPDPGANRRPLFLWNEVSEAAGYQLEVATDAAFLSPVLNQAVPGNFFVPAQALPEGTLFWRVASRDSLGNTSGYSPADSFTIDITPPGVPVLVAGPDPNNDSRPDFDWIAVADAVSYRIQVTTDPTFTTILRDVTISTVRWAADQNLPEGLVYWRVKSRDAAGNESAFSPPAEFEIDVTPLPAMPGPGLDWAAGQARRVYWQIPEPPNDLAHFEVYRQAEPFTDLTDLLPLVTVGGSATQFVDAAALPDVTYYYAVVPIDLAGNRTQEVTSVMATAGAPSFMDGFESGDTSAWSLTLP